VIVTVGAVVSTVMSSGAEPVLALPATSDWNARTWCNPAASDVRREGAAAARPGPERGFAAVLRAVVVYVVDVTVDPDADPLIVSADVFCVMLSVLLDRCRRRRRDPA
jgi:hypothetical protein